MPRIQPHPREQIVEMPIVQHFVEYRSRRHEEDKPLTGAVENVRRLGLIRTRDLVPSPSLRRAARCWPSAGFRGSHLLFFSFFWFLSFFLFCPFLFVLSFPFAFLPSLLLYTFFAPFYPFFPFFLFFFSPSFFSFVFFLKKNLFSFLSVFSLFFPLFFPFLFSLFFCFFLFFLSFFAFFSFFLFSFFLKIPVYHAVAEYSERKTDPLFSLRVD